MLLTRRGYPLLSMANGPAVLVQLERSWLRRPPLQSSELPGLPAQTQPLLVRAAGFIPRIFRIMKLDP